MPVNPSHFISLEFLDYSNESSGFSANINAITAVNIAGFLTDFGIFKTATDAILLGALKSDQWVGDKTKYNNALPTDVDAQRERKFLVTYQDLTSFALYRVELPTADLTGRMVAGTDDVNLANTQIAAWITSFEDLCVSPEGNAINVLKITAVGRNL